MAARLRRRSTSARSRIPRSRAAPEEAGRPRIRPIVCGTPPRPAPRTRSGARDGGVTRPALYRATVPMVPGDGRHAARLGAGGAGAARGGHCAAPRGTDRVHGDDARGRPVLPRLARRGTGAGRRPRRGARDRRGRPRHDARGGVEARSPSSPRRSAGPPGCGGLRGGGELSGGDGPRPAPWGEGVRAARGDELWPLAPGPGPRGGGARPARPDLRLVHRGLRHARPRRGEGAARGARLRPGQIPNKPERGFLGNRNLWGRLAIIFLFAACFQAWREEHAARKSARVAGPKFAMVSSDGVILSQRGSSEYGLSVEKRKASSGYERRGAAYPQR